MTPMEIEGGLIILPGTSHISWNIINKSTVCSMYIHRMAIFTILIYFLGYNITNKMAMWTVWVLQER